MLILTIADEIKKTSSITIITRVISIIKVVFILTIKLKQKITLKEFMYYIYDNINYYKKDYTI